ncbi:MAG: hypothetical protein ACRC7N_04110 [Clostridium sp.]
MIGSLDDIGADEIKVVNELLGSGKNVEVIPRSKVPGINTPDFKVNGVVTELKTLENYNLNTPLKKIRKAFDKQGAEVVIYDVRKAGLNANDVDTIYSRLTGIYEGNGPGKIEFWTNDGIITK